MPDRGPFLMLFATLADDHRDVWSDRGLLFAYCHCAMAANAVYPASFTMPREVDDDEVVRLVADGILDEVGGGRYVFHGLARLRGRLESRGTHGGMVRAVTGSRDGLGRFVPASDDAGQHLNGDAGPTLDVQRSDSAGRSSDPSNRPDKTRGGVPTAHTPSYTGTFPRASAPADPPTGSPPDPAGVGVARSEVGGGRYGAPDVPTCSDPATHGSDWRYYVGVGWRCLTCDAEKPGEPSFREKARDAGAKL
jgi:hypothetical protein